MNIERVSSLDLSNVKDQIALYEYLLLPFYLLLLFFFTKYIIYKYYFNKPERKYIIPGIALKIIGGLFITFVYNYYYRGGDTATYYNEGRIFANILFEHPATGIRILFYNPTSPPSDLKMFLENFNYVHSIDTLIILKITAVINLFTFNSFIITTVLFSYISFWCIWKLVELFIDLFPDNVPSIIAAFILTPSLLTWGSGILKDTVCFSALCIIHVFLHAIFIRKKFKWTYVLYLLIGFYLLINIRIYILIAYLPCFVFYLTQTYKKQINNDILRYSVTPLLVIIVMVASYFIILYIGNFSSRYSQNNLLTTAETQRTYLYYISTKSDGSSYTLGKIDNSIWGLIQKMPAAINVALFRPYLWESKNIIMIFSAIESSFVLFFTLMIFFKNTPRQIWRKIADNPSIQFCLVFSLIFCFFAGISTFNFGSLVRYKIQGFPFYILAILLLNYLPKQPTPKTIHTLQ